MKETKYKSQKKTTMQIYDTISALSIDVSSSRALLLLGNYFISCSSSMFTKKIKICHNKPLLGHCHQTLPQLPRELFLYTRKWSTVNHRLPGKALALLHIYSKGSQAAISTFKTVLGTALFSQTFYHQVGSKASCTDENSQPETYHAFCRRNKFF